MGGSVSEREVGRVLPEDDAPKRIKPPWYVRIFLAFYGLLWLNMIFVAGLNSLRLGHIDAESCGFFLGMTLGFKPIFWFMDKYYTDSKK